MAPALPERPTRRRPSNLPEGVRTRRRPSVDRCLEEAARPLSGRTPTGQTGVESGTSSQRAIWNEIVGRRV